MRIIHKPTVYLVGRQTVNAAEIDRFLADHDVTQWSTDSSVAGEKLCEMAGRVCYMSFAKPRPGGNKAYIERLLSVAHGSVLEHAVWNFIITGVSRAGKTPLSMYLSTRGWKVANVPLIPEIAPPEPLFEVDARRVVGLLIDPTQLIEYRRRRQRTLGVGAASVYTDPTSIEHEIEFAQTIFRRGGFAIVDVTNKPIEESADEVIDRVSRRLRA